MPKSLNSLLLLILLGGVFTGCSGGSIDYSLNSSDSISGSIQGVGSMSSKVGTLSSCLAESVSLYSLKSDGSKDSLIGTAPIDADGKYTISGLRSKNVSLKKQDFDSTKYILEFSCGSNLLQRFVTDSKNQTLGEASSILAWVTQTSAASVVPTQPSSTWKYFYDQLQSADSLTEAFSTLGSNSQLRSRFENTFGVNLDDLLEATPKIKTLSVDTTFSEGEATNLSVTSVHWSASYTQAYLWRLGSTDLSNPHIAFTPNANTQGSYVLQLFIGKNNGSGLIDFSKPYIQQSFDVIIDNTLPATAPVLTRLSPEYTNSTTVSLQIATGAMIDGRPASCHSFSNLAIVEDDFPALSFAPTVPSSYTIDCTQASTQNIPFTLSGTQGIRTLRLWVIDSSGYVSASSRDITLVYDTVAPTLNFSTLDNGPSLRGGTTHNLQWNTNEINPATNTLTIEWSANNGSTWSSLATGVANTGTYSWTAPSINTSQGLFRLTVVDSAGNSGSVTSSQNITIDSTVPAAPSIALASATLSNSLTATISTTCDSDFAQALYKDNSTAPVITDSAWQSCSASTNVTVSSGDGTKTIYAWAKDAVGNITLSPSSVSFTLDQTAPQISLGSHNSGQFQGGTVQTLYWTATDLNWNSQLVSLSYSMDGVNWVSFGSPTTNDGSESVAFPSTDSSNLKVRVSGCDAAGNCTQALSSANLILDVTAPEITSVHLNSGALSSTSNYVNLSAVFTDNLSQVSKVCLKINTTSSPLITDACWKTIDFYGATQGSLVSLNSSVLLGFAPGSYALYIWAQDGTGNISTLSNSGSGTVGLDSASISYMPGSPPVVTNVRASATDNPTLPLSAPEQTISLGGSTHVKWTVASAANGLGSQPVDIYYTTDDATFIPVATGLANGMNGGCSLANSATGCYVFNAPSAGFFRVRVAITDTNSTTTVVSSNPLNVSTTIKFIAGNTDSGIGGSAASSIFVNAIGGTDLADPESLAVASDGTVYFRDITKGIIKISSTDAKATLLLQTTGTSSGDGGPASAATLNKPYMIVTDFQDRLLIYDYDRIRRYDPVSGTITTFICGGVSTADEVSPTDVLCGNRSGNYIDYRMSNSPMIPLPNGDLLFQSENFSSTEGRVRKYVAATNTVTTAFTFSGTGHFSSGSQDIATCNNKTGFFVSMNPTTSAINHLGAFAWCGSTNGNFSANPLTGVSTAPHPPDFLGYYGYSVFRHSGKDGNVYFLSRNWPKIGKYSYASNSVSTLAGTNNLGVCADGTDATSCAMNPFAMDVTKSGQIYFVDNGLIRVIDSDNKIRTLYGQSFYFGDSGDPLSARFQSISSVQRTDAGKTIVLDTGQSRIREFDSTSISTIAGNGTNLGLNDAVDAALSPLQTLQSNFTHTDLQVDATNGNVFYFQRSNQRLYKLNRSTGLWETLVGGGATQYMSADGLLGSQVFLNATIGPVLGIHGSEVLLGPARDTNPTISDSALKLYNTSTGQQTHLAGISGVTTGVCSSGTALSSCMVYTWGSITTGLFDAVGGRWLLATGASIREFVLGGNMATARSLPRSPASFTYKRDIAPFTETYYYCSGGLLYKYAFNSSNSTWTETYLPLPASSMRCSGRNLQYTADGNLLFVYTQNGLSGVAEYINP